MRLSDLFRFSTDNLRRRKGRTILTVIGVVVGVCAIVVMVSLGIAVSKATEEMLQNWGDLRTIQVFSYGAKPDTHALDDTMVHTFKEMPNVLAATPRYQSNDLSGAIVAGNGNKYAAPYPQIVGMDPASLGPMDYELMAGRYPSDKRIGEDKIEIMVGANAVFDFVDTRKGLNNPNRQKYPNYPSYEEAGPNAKPLNLPQYNESGKLLNSEEFFFDIMNTPLTYRMNYGTDETTGEPKYKEYNLVVVGVLYDTDYLISNGFIMSVENVKMLEKEYKKLSGNKNINGRGGAMPGYAGGMSMMGGASGDGTVQVPGYETVYVKVDKVDNMDIVEKAIMDSGYQIYSMSQMRQQMQGQVAQTQVMLGSLAAVSLFVAALNIANTMTMAIYERTREIGVMKVLGCKLANIRALFLIESGAIGLLGGIIGVATSYLISAVLNYLPAILAFLGISSNIDIAALFGMGDMMSSSDMKISIIQPWLVILALCFATGVGVLSGIAPAGRAVKISSLEAIRHE